MRSAFVVLLSLPALASGQAKKLLPADGAALDSFGALVAVSGGQGNPVGGPRRQSRVR